MSNQFANDPKTTYALYKLEDELNAQRLHPHPDWTDITTHKDVVLARYQPAFSPNRIGQLTKAEFESFLQFKNNHHWTQLNRVEKFMTEDMDALHGALGLLVEERIPVRERLNQLRPERSWATHSRVSHLGMPVLTAILQVTQPDKYGIWNNTSDAGMKIVKLWDKRWDKQLAGDSYVVMNAIYLHLAERLQIDLWTLDALWWMLKR